jgi:hypothetical protein
LPDETVEIDPAYFRSDFMEPILDDIPLKVEVVETVSDTIPAAASENEGVEETSESKPASKKRRS